MEAHGGFETEVTDELSRFIAEQDSAYLATASAAGRPYIQHRGGPKGFIRIVDAHTLGWADYRGNRQYVTAGNLAENDRAFLFLMDYERRTRVKLWGRARVVEDDPAVRSLASRLLQRWGYRVLVAPGVGGHINLRWLLRQLGSENVTSLLVEGGGEVNGSFLLQGLAQRVAFFYAPLIFGGNNSRRAVAGEGARALAESPRLTDMEWLRLGPDWLLSAGVAPR